MKLKMNILIRKNDCFKINNAGNKCMDALICENSELFSKLDQKEMVRLLSNQINFKPHAINRKTTCKSVVLSEIVPSGAYVVPLTAYSATTGTAFEE